MNQSPLLRVENLQVQYPTRHGEFIAVKDVSFELFRGEILGIVGESGAGKSTVGNAITGLLTPPGRVTAGKAWLEDQELSTLTSQQLRKVRGKDIGFIFQDPMTSLDPLYTIEDQLTEPMIEHLKLSRSQARERAIELLEAVGIKDAPLRMKQYPHQFSGGMRQRVVIAIALSTNPKFIIADEPTTALDVSIQDQILQLLRKLCQEQNVGCILVTHDMGVVASVTDRVMVMYRGEKVEINATEQVLRNPQHDYSKSLIAAVPPSSRKLDRFPLVSYIEDAGERHSIDIKTHWLGQKSEEALSKEEYILEVKNISLRFQTRASIFPSKRRYVQAVNNVSFNLKAGESFGLVGESGSGKSTTARVISGLYQPNAGEIIFEGQNITHLSDKQRMSMRRHMQMVFQNPYSSVNPRMRVKDIIAEPMRFHRLASSEGEIQQIVRDLIEHVGLTPQAANKFPHEFSGGQRQRISIARALATRPRLLICDEPTSALDVSVQAQILNLLKDLQDELNLTLLFISHDLPVIRQMCNRIGVMRHGTLLEISETESLFQHAENPYTRELISLMPRFDGAA